MRAAIFLGMILLVCPFIGLIETLPNPAPMIIPTTPPTPIVTATATPVPTITPTFTPAPATEAYVEISADRTTLRVGETVTIRAVPVKIGLSIFTLHLSSGGQAHVRYDNAEQTVQGSDPNFEITAMHAEMWLATFTLRALAAGSVDATVDASGELDAGNNIFMWSVRTSPVLTLTVNP